MGNPAGTRYRAPDVATPPVAPHSALCLCDHPVVSDTPEAASSVHGVHHIRSASRN